MQLGVNFHAASKQEAITRLKGAVSVPDMVMIAACAAIASLDGEPTIVKVAIAGEYKQGSVGADKISIIVTAG